MDGLSTAAPRRRLHLPAGAENNQVSLILTARDDTSWRALQDRVEHLDGSRMIDTLPMVRGVVAQVTGKEVYRTIDKLPEETAVYVDEPIAFPSPQTMRQRDALVSKGLPLFEEDSTFHAASAKAPFSVNPDDTMAQGQAAALAAAEQAGPDVDRDLLGLSAIHQMGYTGKGVTVAVVDSGIQPGGDLTGRIKGWKDIENNKPAAFDNFGHGTHIAGEIAGSGQASGGKIIGAAPGADLVGVRITTVVQAIKGLEWVVQNKARYGIRVVNLSLGDPAQDSYAHDLWAQAVEKAIDQGLIVVVAAGNEGPDPGTVSTPGIDPRAITVGALDDHKTTDPGDDRVAEFSSRGPTVPDGLHKPDVVAPGVHIFSTLSPNSVLDVAELPHVGRSYLAISGTSMAAGLVSGIAADMLEANPGLDQQHVKDILMRTARPVKDEPDAQGAGVVDGAAAVREAARLAGRVAAG
ncbi:MAG TPA: S8 family peptidase [Candidatus Xenobia bacterium]|jgi:serine protease AprX